MLIYMDIRGNRNKQIFDKIYDVSENWGEQVLSLSNDFFDNMEDQPIMGSTYLRAMSFFVPSFSQVVDIISDKYKQKFLNDGVKSLDDKDLWLHVDCQIRKYIEREVEVRRCLLNLYRLHNNDWELMPPNKIDVGFIPYPSVTPYVEVKLHALSERFMKEYITALVVIADNSEENTEIFNVKNSTHAPLVKALRNGICLQALKDHGLDGFEENYELMDYLTSTTKKSKQLTREQLLTINY